MATIRDVARVARVAPSTVSFVINGNASVRPQTRRRVEAAMQSLGYQQQRSGRPRQRSAIQIAVVLGGKYYHPAAPLAESVRKRAGGTAAYAPASRVEVENVILSATRRAIVSRGHHFNCFSSFGSVQRDTVFRETVKSADIDGVILMMESPEDGYLQWLLERDLPVVVFNRKPTKQCRFSYVEMDNVGGGQCAAEHFIATGHKRLAVIQSDPEYSYNRDRVDGFVAEVDRRGHAVCLVESPLNDSQLEKTCDKIIGEEVTAVFATSDTLACCCVDNWVKRGIDIPRQLAVVGFDNSGLATEAGLVPSSIGYANEQLGVAAVQAIEQMCHRDSQVRLLSATIKTRLVHQDTTRA